MDYDQIAGTTDPSISVKSKLYEEMIRPFLGKQPSPNNLPYFFEQAWEAWRLDVTKNDIQGVSLFVFWMCQELMKEHREDAIALFSDLFARIFDTGQRSVAAERNYFNARVSGSFDRIINDSLARYKTFFENEFRLWATIPYFFAAKVYGKVQGVNPSLCTAVAAVEKLKIIQGILVSIGAWDWARLTHGFDHAMRNAGAGHDRWEITDRKTVLLQDVNPKSGQPKKAIELSHDRLEQKIKECRKTIWLLEMGISIFANENPKFVAALYQYRPKWSEVQSATRQFAEQRWLNVVRLERSEEDKSIQLELRYAPGVVGHRGSLFYSSGEKYDLIRIEDEVDYKRQCLGVLQYLGRVLAGIEFLDIQIRIVNENGEQLGDARFDNQKVRELLAITDDSVAPPSPNTGSLPEGRTYSMAHTVRVPFGDREQWVRWIKEKTGKHAVE